MYFIYTYTYTHVFEYKYVKIHTRREQRAQGRSPER